MVYTLYFYRDPQYSSVCRSGRGEETSGDLQIKLKTKVFSKRETEKETISIFVIDSYRSHHPFEMEKIQSFKLQT